MHGFSDREISIARALLMSEMESAYLERDQMQSTNLRDEYIQVNLSLSLSLPLFKQILAHLWHSSHCAAFSPK